MVRLNNHEQVNDGRMPTLSKSDGKAGDNTPTVAIRTANTHANGCGVAEGVTHTLDGANGQAVAYPVAMRGNRTKDDRGKFPETDGSGAAYSLTSVQTDSMVAVGFDPSPRECLKRQHLEVGDTMKNGTCPGHHNAVAIGIGRDGWRTTKGEDVMPTLDTRLAAQVDKQMERNGSYLCGPIK